MVAQGSEYRKAGSSKLIKIRQAGVYLIFLLILPLLGFAQPGNPGGDPDTQVEPTVNTSGNPAIVTDGGGGQISQGWINPSFARFQDDTYATLTTTASNQTTNYLLAQNFGFSIPAGSIIKGIIVQVDRYATGGIVRDNKISLIDATGTIGAHNEASPLGWLSIDLDIPQLYGGIINTWGVSDWTPDKINSPDFGVAIMAQTSSQNTTFNLFVDEIRVTVIFLEGGARYAVASGNWNSSGSWSTAPGGAAGASVPTSATDVFIGGGFTITQNVNGANCHSLNIGTSEATPAGRLTFDANSRNMLIGSGGLHITSAGDVLSSFTPTLTLSGDVAVDATLTNRNFLITVNGNNAGILSGSGTIGRLNVQTFITHTGSVTITRQLTGSALRLINGSTAHLTYSGTTANLDSDVLSLITDGNTMEFSQTIADAPDFDIHQASGTFHHLVISGNAPKYYSADITINGDLSITATGILNNQSQNGITLSGNWTNNNGAAGFVPNSCNACTVIFRGGLEQTIINSSGEDFYRIQVAKDANTTVRAANNIVINNQLLIITGQFDVGSNSLTGTANTVMNGGNLIIGTTGTTVPELTGTYSLVSGVITFNGAGPQSIRSTTSAPAVAAYKTVEFTGSGTKSLSGPIVVDTDLNISGSATLDVTTFDFGITISGDWTNTSTFNPRNGTVTFGGTATLMITNPNGAVYHNLTINNSAISSAVILNNPVTVGGLLTFTDGHIISSDTSLLTLGSGATVVSASDGSHVTGPVAKVVTSTNVFAFPVGSGTNYMPASITPTSTAATTFIAQYYSLEQSVGTKESGIDHVSSQDYWTIERTSGTAEAAVTLVWKYSSLPDAEIDNLTDLLVAQWDGTNWVSRGNAGTTGNFVAGSVQSNTISSFTPPYFVIGSSTENNPLSNYRYFAQPAGNWNTPGVWSYRPGGPTDAPEPTANKLVVIESGTVTILDFPFGQSVKSMRSLTILGTLNFGNSIGQDITVNIGDRGLMLGTNGNITGSDNGDEIRMSGNITLNNTSDVSHAALETNFVTMGNTITGTGGNLPILNVTQGNQTFTGSTSFTTLTVASSATNNGTITITGSFSGNGTLTNGTTGTVIWQGTSASNNGIIATAPGNTIQLVNNTGGNLDINQFVTSGTYSNLILGGVNNFIQGDDVDITGDFTILPDAVFNISSSNDLNIFGNWTNDGTFNATNGTVVFNGTTAISGSSANNFNHVQISGSVIPGATFNIRGNFTNNGSFAAGTGTVIFNGNTRQLISGSTVTTFNNISVTNASAIPAVQVQSDQNMTGVLTLSNNSVFDADGSSNDKIFTLLSSADDPTIDASIAALPSGASVAGDVTVQRYMSIEGSNNGRIYRYISSPVQDAPVSQIQAFIPVTGTFAGASSCSGCGTNQSMFRYDETVITDINGSGVADFNDGYLNFPAAANSETFSPGRGYSIFVRGNIAPVSAGSALWSLRGPINSGDVSLPVTFTSSGTEANDGWNLVGNPYPSTIDWDADGWTRTNLNNTTYVLDNGLASPVFATHVAGGESTNRGSRYIATGQAFYVKGTGGTPVLTAAESVKASGTQTAFFRTKGIEDIMRVTLREGTKADEAVIQFMPDATTGFDLNADAHKLDNPAPMYSLATLTDGLRYAINALPAPTSKTEVHLDISYTQPGSYSLEFTEFESFADDSMPIILRDDFLGTETDIRVNPVYAFQVTADAASFGDARFTIVFGNEVVTGLEGLDASHIAVYPNPTKNMVNVEVRSDKDVHAKIVSLTGSTLFELALQGELVRKGSFNLEDQTDGIYILIVQEGAELFVKKILKKR